MPKVKLPEDAEPDEEGVLEVEPNAIHFGEDEAPEGYVSADSLQSTVQSRVERTKRDTKKALANDEEFLRSNFSKRFGVELREDGRPQGAPSDEELQKLRRRAARAEELEETNESLQQSIQEARTQRLEGSLLSQMDDVKESLRPAALREAKTRMTWDDTEGQFVIEDENGQPIYDGAEPAGPDYVIEMLREEAPDFFKDRSAKSSGYDPGSGAGASDAMSREAFEELSPSDRRAFMRKGGRITTE